MVATFSVNSRIWVLLLRVLCIVTALAVATFLAGTSYAGKVGEHFFTFDEDYLPSREDSLRRRDKSPVEDSTSVDATILFWNDLYRQKGGKAWFEAPASWIGPEGVRNCPIEDPDDDAIHFPDEAILQRPVVTAGQSSLTRDTPSSSHEAIRCNFAVDKSRLQHADLVVFSGQYSDGLESLKPPPRTDPNQIWVFYSVETPVHAPMSKEAYAGWISAFNWTATYRLDSDVPLRYGRVVRCNKLSPTWTNNDAYDKQPNDEELKILQGKEFLVAAIIGNCNPKHLRHRLIKFLKRNGIKVHVYGNCGIHGVCPPWNEDCYPKLAGRYKFFLAAENSVCPDYVTEKMFKGLNNPWIPIVYGGADYSRFAPPHAVIQARVLKDNSSSLRKGSDVSLFDTRRLNPHELVELIRRLDKNDTEYLSYFRWKRQYQIEYPPDWGCALCRKIVKWKENPEKPRKTYNDMHAWWEIGSQCRIGV